MEVKYATFAKDGDYSGIPCTSPVLLEEFVRIGCGSFLERTHNGSRQPLRKI